MIFEPLRLRRWAIVSPRVWIAALVLGAAFAGSAPADTYLPAIGGGGGSSFSTRCAEGELLGGVELRAGDWVDAIRPLCVIAHSTRDKTSVWGEEVEYDTYVTTAGVESAWHGGQTGQPVTLRCPRHYPFIYGLGVDAEGADTITVYRITLVCGYYHGIDGRYNGRVEFIGSDTLENTFGAAHGCPAGQVAVGIYGRSGIWLDAMGLICDAPPVILPAVIVPPLVVAMPKNEPVKAQGRVKLAPGTAPGSARPICELAAGARARNSPAAPGLEAKCAARESLNVTTLAARGETIAKEEPLAAALRDKQADEAARRGFEIGLAAAEWQTLPGPGKQKIHDVLDPSEQGAYNLAVNFSLALYKKKLADFLLKGAAIANEDPVSAEFRELQADASARRGFEIGLAAAQGQTAPGPGKQKIRGALSSAEQGGYDTAVTYSLERNTYKDRAATGEAIAKADPIVGLLRNSETDALYRLGFDIATAIFGGTTLGGEGKTLTGPGSLGVRDSLSPAGQLGFDAAGKLQLGANYKR